MFFSSAFCLPKLSGSVFLQLYFAGFTWRDDYTQHIIARELSNLPKTHEWHLETFSSEDPEDSTRYIFMHIYMVAHLTQIVGC